MVIARAGGNMARKVQCRDERRRRPANEPADYPITTNLILLAKLD